MRRSLSDKGVGSLKPRSQRYAYPDPELRGHYIRVQPSGAKAYTAVARGPNGKQIWATIGPVELMEIDQARAKARQAITRIREGLPAIEAPPDQPSSFKSIAEQWLDRHVRRNALRSEKESTRLLNVHIFPQWKGRQFLSIKRSDIAELLDHVQDDHGARQADYCLNVIRSIMNWYATRSDYTPPIVRNMRRQSAKAQARARILSDDEIRLIWKQAEANGVFGGVLRVCLLTAQRSRKVSNMKWSDISVDGEWTIPKEPREKDTAGSLVLPELAIAIIRQQPRLASNEFVFSGRGAGPYRGWSQAKTNFDSKLPGLKAWVIHDVRRTSRSLLSRCNIRPDISERIMGHAVGSSVEQTYDRHSYRNEKADALKRLAALIDSIVNPRDNVLPMAKTRKRKS
jgi:integrase